MLLELVLVAAVLALAGLAVYQANHRQQAASNLTETAAPDSAEGLAASAAAIVSDESADDANADILADEITASDADVTTLGGSSNAGF
jgi:hypothetical protein